MKKLLLIILIVAPLCFVAQSIKKQKVKTSFISYPKIDVANMDVSTIKVDFCAGDVKYLDKSVKKTSTACKPKQGTIKDAKLLEVFYYQIAVQNPESYIKISDASGNIAFMEQTSTITKGFVDFGKKKCYWLEPILKSAYEKEKSKFESKSQKESVKVALSAANDYLNSALFFTYVPQELQVFYVKNKDYDYSDLETASKTAADAYKNLKGDAENESAKSKLKEAITIWEKALEESTPDVKKSRINKKVTLAISENIGTAYFYLLEFDKAQKVIGEALALEKNFTTNGTERRKALLYDIRAYSKAYEINKNTPINTETVKVPITTHPSSDLPKFKNDFKQHGHAELVEEIKANKEEHEKGVADGSINPYQQYVMAVAGGNQLTLPDLGAKLLKAPAGKKLDEFPEEVTSLDLVTLILRGNNLKSIPASIGKMTGLKKLNLANNQLTSLPDEIGELKNLKTLILKGNSISQDEINKIQMLLPDCKIKL